MFEFSKKQKKFYALCISRRYSSGHLLHMRILDNQSVPHCPGNHMPLV